MRAHRDGGAVVREVRAELVEERGDGRDGLGAAERAPPAGPPRAPGGLDRVPGHAVLQLHELPAHLRAPQTRAIMLLRCMAPLMMLLMMHQPHLHQPWRLESFKAILSFIHSPGAPALADCGAHHW